MREKYRENPSAVWTPEKRKRANKLTVDRNRQLRDEVVSAYGGECVACGETEPLFLTLDHVNNDGHVLRKESSHATSASLYRWVKKHNYPDSIQVLCMNCNFGKARNGGVLVKDRRGKKTFND
jgi:5-methylcytosine-specific restriction endonuclease McrA